MSCNQKVELVALCSGQWEIKVGKLLRTVTSEYVHIFMILFYGNTDESLYGTTSQ